MMACGGIGWQAKAPAPHACNTGSEVGQALSPVNPVGGKLKLAPRGDA
jgi:hypothetical protein